MGDIPQPQSQALPSPKEEIGAKDKVSILLKEYDALRAEILARTKTRIDGRTG